MQTGDGLLVRLRPASGFFTPQAFLSLLDAAEAFGNGRLDITARGNLQLRGLTGESASGLAWAVVQAGIPIVEGLGVEMPPLSGLDPSEFADPRPLAKSLAARIAASGLVFAPKLSVIVDGGGHLHLGDLPADLRLVAGRGAGGIVVWHLFVGPVAILAGDQKHVEDAAMAALGRIAALGPAARARDLAPDALACDGLAPDGVARLPTPLVPRPRPSLPVGRIDLGDCVVLGLAPAFGQMSAQQARQLILAAMDHGLTQVRLAPGRALLLLGMDVRGVHALQHLAGQLGFVADASDAALTIDACTGVGGCASGGIDTQATARDLLQSAPALADGSVAFHVSGCPKGCVRPRASHVTLVAVAHETAAGDRRLGLVLDGRAGDNPIATSELGDAAFAIAGLGHLVASAKQSGESAASCLKRLGPARIAASFQRD
jgi:precorrin-3B synthase